MNLHERVKKNEFGYAVAGSPSLACKILALIIYWQMIGRPY